MAGLIDNNTSTEDKIYYSPALRFKLGEYRALSRLPKDVRDRVTPQFILPPPKEPDIETRRVIPTVDELVYLTGYRIGHYWPLKTCFVDAGYLFTAFGTADASAWLPRLFHIARNFNGRPVPLATLDDMLGDKAEALRLSMPQTANTKLGIRVMSGELDSSLLSRVTTALKAFGLSSTDCSVFVDFSDAEMSDVSAIASFISIALEAMQEIGVWQNVVIQGTNYPAKNPATPGSATVVSRNEWLSWNEAIGTDPNVLKRSAFGDYGADYAPIGLTGRASKAKAIPHYRYCSKNGWIVARGKRDIPQAEAMKAVCNMLLSTGEFSGADFSEADKYIHDTAIGVTTGGSATTWREMNTIRHITMVVSQLGGLHGYGIRRSAIIVEIQEDLFKVGS